MLHNTLAWEPICKDAIILGRGASLKLLLDSPIRNQYPIFMAGSTGLFWPLPAYLWCCLHSEMLLDFAKEREQAGFHCVSLLGKSPLESERYPYYYIPTRAFPGGTSALFAAEVAAGIGYERLHVFGVELTTPKYEVERPNWRVFHGAELVPYGDSLSWLDLKNRR